MQTAVMQDVHIAGAGKVCVAPAPAAGADARVSANDTPSPSSRERAVMAKVVVSAVVQRKANMRSEARARRKKKVTG